MSPERWQRVQEVFDAAMECAPSETEDFLREACGSDEGLANEVRRLLEAHARTGVLDAPMWEHRESAPQSVFQVGQTVAGRYRILRYLSRGGMGEVYEAQDLELQERVALKTLLPEIASDARMIARFKQEIQLSRRIGHPNVCRVFDLARHPADGPAGDGVFFLTMEFLAGETLAARLSREGRMSSAEALPLIEQMASALDAAHHVGVIHRDLKPSNVMLVPGDRPRAVVTDFGLARRQVRESDSTETLTGKMMGTVNYMAPELLSGATANIASDVYALGMVSYKMIADALPFDSDAPLAGAVLRGRQTIPSPRTFVSELDPRWERAILKALERDPARRYSSAGRFVEALRGEPAALTLALPEMNRRRWLAAVTGFAAMVAAGVAWRGWDYARHRPSPEAEALYRKGSTDIEAGAYFAATKTLGEALKLAPHYAPGHARLAEAWVELDMPERASEELIRARRENSDTLSAADRLQIEGVDLTITREFEAAVAKYEALAKLAGPGDSGVAVDLGRAYEKAGRPEQATKSYSRAAQSATPNPAAWLRLGVIYGRASNAVASDEAFGEAERLYQMTSNLEGLTEVAFQRGVAANERGQLAEGARFLQIAFDRAKIAENVQQEVRTMLQLSTNAFLAGDTDRAEQYARGALEKATGQMETMAVRGLVTLGNAYARRRDFAGAEKYYREALDLAQRNHSMRLAALSFVSLAALHDQLGKSEEGRYEAEQALAFYEPNRFMRESLQCLTLLGRFQDRRGDYEGALGYYQRALALAEKTQDRYLTALAHESMGTVLEGQQNYPEALPHYQKQLELSTGAEQAGYAALNCSGVLWFLGRPAEASAMFKRADAVAGKFASLRLSLMRSKAKMALSQGDYAEAARLARGALRAGAQPPDAVADLTRILGLAALGSGDGKQARADCQRALEAAAKLDDVDLLLSARLALAQVQLAAGDHSAALDLFRQAEPVLAHRPESRWRALAMESRADRQYQAAARAALEELRRQWGDHAFQTYLTRPEIQQLAGPILRTVSANH